MQARRALMLGHVLHLCHLAEWLLMVSLLNLQPVVIDCRGHMLGRLASILAKQLLTGQYVVRICTQQALLMLLLAWWLEACLNWRAALRRRHLKFIHARRWPCGVRRSTSVGVWCGRRQSTSASCASGC